ncbi:MAG: hypothetical protein ACLTLQ_15930 [[Clostridium] scindens]
MQMNMPGMFIAPGMGRQREVDLNPLQCSRARRMPCGHVMETVWVFSMPAKVKVLRICGGGAKSRTSVPQMPSMLHMPVYLLDEKIRR